MVYDDNPDIAGFYEEEGTFNGKPKYKHCEDTGYLLYYFIDTLARWVIHTTTDEGDYTKATRYQEDKTTIFSPDLVESWSNSFTSVVDNIKGPVISGANLSTVVPGRVEAGFLLPPSSNRT